MPQISAYDNETMEEHSQEEKLDQMYRALKQIEGMIQDPVSDSSENIDEIVYGRI